MYELLNSQGLQHPKQDTKDKTISVNKLVISYYSPVATECGMTVSW